jgi:hypothetical protein
MPCSQIANLRNLKKTQNNGYFLPSIDDNKTNHLANISESKTYDNYTYPKDDKKNKKKPKKLLLNNYVKKSNDEDKIYMYEEEPIKSGRRLYRNDKELEEMFEDDDDIFNNKLNKTQVIDLKKLAETVSKIKGSIDDNREGYDYRNNLLPKTKFNN